MNCIIVEDELPAQKILIKYISDTKLLNLKRTCNSAIEAFEEISRGDIDLMFLDINLPTLSGTNFLKSLSKPPMVIFTTAYAEYAVEGFELDAVDYLLKPFAYVRFLKAVNKAWIQFNLQGKINDSIEKNTEQQHSEHLFVRSEKKDYRIVFDDLLYIEACGDYVKLHLKDKRLMINETMKSFHQKLPERSFLRIHKSYIIQIACIDYLEGNMVRIDGIDLPVGSVYKEPLRAWIKIQ